MQYKCKVEVIDKKVFPELQDRYLADPKSGSYPFYQMIHFCLNGTEKKIRLDHGKR